PGPTVEGEFTVARLPLARSVPALWLLMDGPATAASDCDPAGVRHALLDLLTGVSAWPTGITAPGWDEAVPRLLVGLDGALIAANRAYHDTFPATLTR